MYIQQYDFDVQYLPGIDAKMATADLLSHQGHEARVQGLLSNEDHNAAGAPQITSIFGAAQFCLYQLEEQVLYDVRRALENGSEHVVSDDPEAQNILPKTKVSHRAGWNPLCQEFLRSK